MGKLVKANKNAGALVPWKQQMEEQAAIAAGMEASTATGQFFSTKGGILSFNDSPIPNNEMGVIILDSILENVFYAGRYDPDSPQGPTCFAFGRNDVEMAPHEIVIDKQHETCAGCPQNEFGSAETGRGKACKNTRRIAMIPAGSFNKGGEFESEDDEQHYVDAQAAFLRLPITSVKGYAAFVKQIAAVLRRPPCGIFTKVSVVPDASDQFKVVFTPIAPVPDELMPIVMKRNEDMKLLIDFPYKPFDEEAAPARPAARKAGKPAAGKAAVRPARRF